MGLLHGVYTRWRKKPGGHIQIRIPIFNEILRDWDSYDVYRFGSIKELQPSMTLVDAEVVAQYPELLPDAQQRK